MLDNGVGGVEAMLKQANKACRGINLFMKALLAVFCLCWLAVLVRIVFSLLGSELAEGSMPANAFSLVLHFGYGAVIVALFVVFIGVMSGVAKGESPFVMTQVKRLRIIAGLLGVYALVDCAISANKVLMQYDGMNVVYISAGYNMVIPINVAPLIAAAVVLAFSYVFQYGVLLQELSDETL